MVPCRYCAVSDACELVTKTSIFIHLNFVVVYYSQFISKHVISCLFDVQYLICDVSLSCIPFLQYIYPNMKVHQNPKLFIRGIMYFDMYHVVMLLPFLISCVSDNLS